MLTPLQPAMLNVMPDHPHSTSTGRADRYLTPLQPAALTVIPAPLYSLLSGRVDRYVGSL